VHTNLNLLPFPLKPLITSPSLHCFDESSNCKPSDKLNSCFSVPLLLLDELEDELLLLVAVLLEPDKA